MWRVLVPSLLVAVVSGQGLDFSGALSYDRGYLPPAKPDRITPKSVRCDDPKTIFNTVTTQVTNTVIKTVTVKVPQVIRKTVVVSKVVPTTNFVTSVKQVRSPVVRIQEKTEVVNRVIKKTINVPGGTRVVKKTEVQSQISFKTDKRTVTITETITDTQVRLLTDVKRVTELVTQRVPKVVYVTRTVKVPGRDVVVTSIDRKQVTQVKEYQPPAKTQVKNEIKYVRSVVVRQVPGPVISETKVVLRTQIIEKTSVKRVPEITTSIVREIKEVVKMVTKEVPVTRTVIKYVYKTETVPVIVKKIEERIINKPLRLTKTVTSVKSVPGPDVVRTSVKTVVQVKTVRGPDRIITDVRTVTSDVTVVSKTTIIRPSTVSRVITKTQPCRGGYNYDAPHNPLQF